MGVFTMPSLGADMEAGTLVEWLIQPGDTVHRGDVVAVVETQKGAIEIESFQEGTVYRLEAQLGMELPVGTPLALILAEGEAPPEAGAAAPAAPPPAPTSTRAKTEPAPPRDVMTAVPVSSHAVVSPAARVRARELGIDLATVGGSGPGGAILLSDLESAAGPRQAPKPAARPPGSPKDEMRSAIAAAMTRSKQTIPHFYMSHTIDIQPAEEWLSDRNEGRDPDDRLLLGALLVRAAALAAARVPDLNGHFLDGGFRASKVVNAGVAVALRGGGLVAPALMDAPSMSLVETMAAMRDVVVRARTGRLRNSEMTEGTITISALGESGAEVMTGVIFPPQVALVNLGAPQVRPWVVGKTVVPRSVVTLSMSADHRVADGRQVARFIRAFDKFLQTPEEL